MRFRFSASDAAPGLRTVSGKPAGVARKLIVSPFQPLCDRKSGPSLAALYSS
jgi:hypothetical protein